MRTLLTAFLTLFCCSFLFAADITLAENGKAKATIVIPANAKRVVKFAATELASYLKKITGATFAVGTTPGKDVNIYLGMGNTKGLDKHSFVISAKGKRIDIYGKDSQPQGRVDFYFNLFYDNQEQGTLRGVYNFLDSLGVRWLAPGKDGEFVPVKKTLRVPEQFVRPKVVFADRQIAEGWNFMKHPDAKEYATSARDVFLWGVRNNVSSRGMVPGCHSENSLKLPKDKGWMAHPEAHQLMKSGKRNPRYSCWTDPYTKEVWMRAVDGYFSGKTPAEAGFPNLPAYLHSTWPMPFISPDEFMIDPMDHSGSNDGRCWCDRCEAFRKKYPCNDDTEIVWKFLCEIADHVAKKYPGKYISTLVYPPKSLIPRYTKRPKNIRVRICIQGARYMQFPNLMARDLKKVKDWGDFLGPKNVPLWTYQCITFARFLPGVPVVYPHMMADFIRELKPLSAGMFCENHNLTHTLRNFDVYIFMRLMWNPDRNVDKEIDEYIRLYYGPAAAPAKEFYTILEKNWKKADRLVLNDDPNSLGAVREDKDLYQKKVWSQVYTRAEMAKLENLVKKIKELSPAGSVYAKRAKLLEQYGVGIMNSERSEVMDKEERRQQFNLNVGATNSTTFPTAAEWAKAPERKLIQAERLGPALQANGSFKVLASQDTFYLKADLQDPEMAKSATNRSHKNGNVDIWKDNCIELFFFIEKSKRFWQIIVNDNNAWSSATRGRALLRWKQLAGVKVKTKRTADGWTAEIAIPFKSLGTDKNGLRFCFTRERNIKGSKTEFSTWSPLTMLGNWHATDNYADVVFEK